MKSAKSEITDSLSTWRRALSEALEQKEQYERLGLPVPPRVEADIVIYSNLVNIEEGGGTMVEALAQVMKPPFQLIENAIDNEWTFPMMHYPSERESAEDPPVQLNDRPEVIAIDGLLGLYAPGTQQITVFTRGISRVAEILKVRGSDLTFVVRLHEWAHALLHMGLPYAERVRVTERESLWPEQLAAATAWFHSLDSTLHERLAQLLSHYSLCSLMAGATVPEAQIALERIARTFRDLTRRSPAEYHIDEYTRVPKGRILSSVRLLKSSGLVGRSAWETVVAW